jgi:hypothetical protein
MSFQAYIIKTAIKWTPESLILWVSNKILKNIAQLQHFHIDMETRQVSVQVQLAGEIDSINVLINEFAIVQTEKGFYFIVRQAESNKLWLTNIFQLILNKKWYLPEIPQIKPYMPLILELVGEKEAEENVN